MNDHQQLPLLKIVVQSGPNQGQAFAVKDRPLTIGRGASNDVVISHFSLSRLHARVRATPHGFVVDDLGSTNGTFVNEAKVTGSAPLRPGDTIRLGTVITLKVEVGPAGAGGRPDEDKTLVPPAGSARGDTDRTVVPEATAVRPPPSGRAVQTVVSTTPVVSVQSGQRNLAAWLWMVVAVLVTILIIGAGLGYLYYATTPPPPPPTEIALPPTPTPTNTPEPPTSTPSPEPTATPEPIKVPGVPAAVAQELAAPPNATNQVDPFCQTEIEVTADEPVFIQWERPLAEADGETDYLAEWLASVHYDITLDGRPISTFNYYRVGPSLHWWHNLGLLPAGKHYLRIQWYTSRQISNGLDVAPADGQVDVFGPGPAGEGFCEIVVPEPIAAATPTPVPTATPESTPTPTPTPQPTKAQQSQVSTSPAPLGVFQDFESQSTWKRGDQPYGEFTRSSAQAHSGRYAGQLSYNFPTANNDYVVFLQSRALAGQPNAISAWVYGDGSGHFLNMWLKDAQGQTWGMSFGQVKHTGWQEMAAYIDPSQPWPSGHISGPDNGVIDYPISFQALVLDDGNDDYSGRGTIYIDDLNSQAGVAAPTPTPASLAGTTVPGGGQVISGPSTSGGYTLALGRQHKYEEPWGAARGDLCQTYNTGNWDDTNPNFRGFNLELSLTNDSNTFVADGWLPIFITARGQRVQVCYHSYGGGQGTGVAPGETGYVTFFSLVPKGDYVQTVQLTVNGYTLQICLDGNGGYCR